MGVLYRVCAFLPKLTDIVRMEKNWKNAEEKIFISQGLRESEE